MTLIIIGMVILGAIILGIAGYNDYQDMAKHLKGKKDGDRSRPR